MSAFVFETPRLRAVRLSDAHVDAMHAIYGDRESMRYVGDGEPLSRDGCVEWIAVTHRNYRARGYGMWALESRENGDVVGFLGLVHPGGQHEAEVKYAFHPRVWGQGFATEAVKAAMDHARTFGLAHVVATVAPGNASSSRVLEKSGFRARAPRINEDGSTTLVYECVLDSRAR